jgi:hypothetical protein
MKQRARNFAFTATVQPLSEDITLLFSSRKINIAFYSVNLPLNEKENFCGVP